MHISVHRPKIMDALDAVSDETGSESGSEAEEEAAEYKLPAKKQKTEITLEDLQKQVRRRMVVFLHTLLLLANSS